MLKKRSVTLTLHVDRDADILAWIDARENSSSAIRDVLRAHITADAVTLADILAAIHDLQRGGLVVLSQQATATDEPADIAAALDGLGR